ncbi:helix-turn-helix domain-containing protein [Mucilaginibacter sp. UR6-1]|uniref:helix-turn-helix domain-containing protein n=1 Tax=Mucilaginibacter sp. UR6-1 TaxID=1435643 RepID=UPI001E5F7376|nr:helix-turn-helix transcriptional regulator [Mucilaginibacter sp. UR6-1]MCC8409071.1 helix-turn-helix domain-containing protein [Mucilaginibacter sp. UR6-1]
MAETLHIGRKIARIRELKGIKQEALAIDLGVSQQTISNIEKSDKIEEEVLEKIAKALGVPADAIKNFSEEAVINIISSTLHHTSGLVNYNPTFTFNPIDKWLEVLEENKKLYNEKVELLERLLQAEKEKNELLKGRS